MAMGEWKMGEMGVKGMGVAVGAGVNVGIGVVSGSGCLIGPCCPVGNGGNTGDTGEMKAIVSPVKYIVMAQVATTNNMIDRLIEHLRYSGPTAFQKNGTEVAAAPV